MAIGEMIFDEYSRKARLAPALITLVPPYLLFNVVHVDLLGTLNLLLSLLGACGALFLIANLTRRLGKRWEKKEFSAPAKKPTNRILSNSDNLLDRHTKDRYRNYLSGILQITVPQDSNESQYQSLAYEAYEACTRWLISQTRDSKRFPLILKENISYGFHRNMLGLKPLAITIILFSIAYAFFQSGFSLPEKPVSLLVLLLVLALIYWIFLVTPKSVHEAGVSYAERLYEAINELSVRN